MSQATELVEIWRGDFLESLHLGHAVVCRADGEVVEAWGDPDKVILPRSSSKMFQALPLVESGAAEAFGLTDRQLALACASHDGAAIHTEAVEAWLGALGLREQDLICGPQRPMSESSADGLIRNGIVAGRCHNNCSGKHSGFLCLSQHLGADLDYVGLQHPVQRAVLDAFEDMTGETSPGHGIDGCSAPNYACSLKGLARAGARIGSPVGSDLRARASTRVVDAMRSFPEMVAGEGRACTELMRAAGGSVALKTGAEGVYLAILPDAGLGIALKIEDGATRAAECAIAGLLVKYSMLDPKNPAAIKRLHGPIKNFAGIETGHMRLSAGFLP